jgi:hypothetical protein
MAFKMKGYPKQQTSALKQNNDKRLRKKFSNVEVRNALENWKEAEHNSEDYRINQLEDGSGSRKEFMRLDSITKEKRRVFENMEKNSDFKSNIIVTKDYYKK